MNNLIKKWIKDINRHFPKEDINCQEEHEKMFNITKHQGNENQNHNEVPILSIIKKLKIANADKDLEKTDPLYTDGEYIN
jgi:hypothetical protein